VEVVGRVASLLNDIPEEIQRIAGRLVWRWWVEHGLPECMCRLKEVNKVSFISRLEFLILFTDC
jgi:hypothetical protein